MSTASKRHIPVDFSDLKAPGAAAAAAPTPRGPVTGVGLMSAVFAGKQQLEQQVQDQQQRIEQLQRERGAVLLNPQAIQPSRWANRHADSFAGPEFAELKAEIRDAGGNVQPIMVRPLPGGAAGQYELVFGHRRHRACLELGLQVRAVVDDIDEQTLFVRMERENRNRAGLSAYEQGTMYRRALDAGLYPSARQLAAAVGMDLSQLGKALRIADLPHEVIAAFPSPTQIQFKFGPELSRALERNPDAVIRRARELAGSGTSAPFVLAHLVNASEGGGTVPPPAAPARPVQASGADARGSGTVPPPMVADAVFQQVQAGDTGGGTVPPPAPASAWRTVPVGPTDEWVAALLQRGYDTRDPRRLIADVLAAAPKAK